MSFRNAIGFFGSSGAGYEAETLALLSRMSVQPDTSRKILMNALIKNLKDNSFWNGIDILRLDASHSEQASLLNWKGDYCNGIKTNSPVFTIDRGWAGGFLVNCINSGFNPYSGGFNWSQNNAGLMFYMNVATGGGSSQMHLQLGTATNFTSYQFRPQVPICTGNINCIDSGSPSFGNVSFTGFKSIRRNSGTTFRHGTNKAYGNIIKNSSALENKIYSLDAGSTGRQAMILYSKYYDDTSWNLLQDILLEYLTTIGANV